MKKNSEKFDYSISQYGSSVSSNIPITLYRSFEEKTIDENDLAMIDGLGMGLYWVGDIKRV